jgi:hypothetical protein
LFHHELKGHLTPRWLRSPCLELHEHGDVTSPANSASDAGPAFAADLRLLSEYATTPSVVTPKPSQPKPLTGF